MEILIQFDKISDWGLLSSDEVQLVDAAIQISESAYAKYSNFHVGVALLLENGEVVLGSNQENIAFPSGLCAERTALFTISRFKNHEISGLWCW